MYFRSIDRRFLSTEHDIRDGHLARPFRSETGVAPRSRNPRITSSFDSLIGRISVALLALLGLARHADAGCNLIPGTAKSFNAALGATNRPFAAPGERLEVTLRDCDAGTVGLTADAADHLVTIVFQPPTGPRNAVVLTSAANCSALKKPLATCAAQLTGGGTATCIAAANSGLAIVEHNGERFLSFRFPDTRSTCSGGSNAGKRCTQPSDCSDGTCVAGDEDSTLAGPAAIAVTAPGDPLPCGLAASPCTSHGGLRACVDDFYANDGSCGTSVPLATFPHFTALPAPNEYARDCYKLPGVCNPTAANLRFGVDLAGNLLLPVSWQSVLVPSAVPVPRLLRTRFLSPLPFTIPDAVFTSSFTPEGGKLPPIFEPQLDPSIANPDVISLFGSVDAPYTILRIGRRFGTCQGGGNDGTRCNVNEDCPGGACPTTCVGAPTTPCTTDGECGGDGPCGQLYDVSGVLDDGPFLLPRAQITTPDPLPGMCQETAATCLASCGGDGPCVNYAFEAEAPVNLSSLADKTATLRSFTTSEAIAGADLNGDGDMLDTVATLRDRASGVAQDLAGPAGCGTNGRVVMQSHDGPFSFPAVAVENDVLAYLESETDSNRCVENGDQDYADAILRIARLGVGETDYDNPPRAVDAAPRIDGKPLVVSHGRVFVRSGEAAMARQHTERIPPSSQGNASSRMPSLSADGRLVAFASNASNLVGGDTNCVEDVFVYDRELGATQRVSVGPGGAQALGLLCIFGSTDPRISADGRYVAFRSYAANLLGPGLDTNDWPDVFVHDRQTGVTERVNVGPGGAETDGESYGAALSADGRFVAFGSQATTLLGPGGDTNGAWDIFVRDRTLMTTERVSVQYDGGEADAGGNIGPLGISADGRFVAFSSDSDSLVSPGGDTNFQTDVFVRDRQAQTNERVSVGPNGAETDGQAVGAALSADGQVIAFISDATNILGPGSNPFFLQLVYTRDRRTGTTNVVSVGPGGIPQHITGGYPAISANGRFVAFQDPGDAFLGPGGDTNGTFDNFVHDRSTGTTERVSVGPNGLEADGDSGSVLLSLSADGRTVAYHSLATNLLGPGNDTNGVYDVFVRGPDPADPIGIDAILFEDGELTATVLEAIDATTGNVTTLCPAGEVATAAGNAAFLRPEAPVSVPTTPACPKGSLNADADTSDEVAQLWPGSGGVQNLHCAATAVAMSPTWVGALVSEAGEGADHDGDLDQDDAVAAFHRVAGPFGTACTGGGSQWIATAQVADALVVSDTSAVFVTPEADQESSPGGVNGDGDALDRVLQVYALDAGANAAAAAPCTPGPNTACTAGVRVAAEDFVAGDASPSACGNVHLVAFRTSEAAEGATNLNAVSNGAPTGDADAADGVLQVYDVVAGELVNTGQAVTPCRLEACDPRQPYQVRGSVVKFLTFEPEQGGQDLNRDGTSTQLILQSFDFCTSRVTVIGAVATAVGQNPLDVPDESHAFFSPAGRCDLGVTCDPGNDLCPAGSACEDDTCIVSTEDPEAVGTCTKHTGLTCAADADCKRCTLRQPASCLADADCPAGATCEAQLVVAVTAVEDGDDDGVPNPQDNCPATPNTAQADTDSDGVGDACDVQQCGNGIQETGEACEDGNVASGDGCSATCTFDCTAAPVPGCLVAAQAQLDVNEQSPGKEKLKLQWKQVVAATTVADFGDPVGGSTIAAVCLYGDGGTLAGSYVVDRSGDFCAGKPCWKAQGTKGLGYQDKKTSADGITKLAFGAGAPAKGKASAAGANNPGKGQTRLPTGVSAALAGSSMPTMQLVTDHGFCVGTTLTEVTRDAGGRFQARKK